MLFAHKFPGGVGRLPQFYFAAPDSKRAESAQPKTPQGPATITLTDVQNAFEAAGEAVRNSEPRAETLQARALYLFQSYNVQHNKAIQLAAKEQIDLIQEKLGDADDALRAVLEAKLRVWEGMLLEASASLSRAEAERESVSSSVRDGKAA